MSVLHVVLLLSSHLLQEPTDLLVLFPVASTTPPASLLSAPPDHERCGTHRSRRYHVPGGLRYPPGHLYHRQCPKRADVGNGQGGRRKRGAARFRYRRGGLPVPLHTTKEAGDAPNPPKFLTLAMEVRGEGGSGAEVEARQKRALCKSLVEYLWRGADHGSLYIGGGFLVLPGAGSAEEGAAGPSVPEKANSVASGASFTGATTRKRTLDELQDAVEELSERQSLAEGLGQCGAKPTEPTPKRPLTFVSIPNKVSPCLSCRSRVGTIHYGPLISLGLIISKANLKFVSHIFSTRDITTSMTLRSTVGDQRSFLFLLFLYTLCRIHIPVLGDRRSFLFLLFLHTLYRIHIPALGGTGMLPSVE